MLNQLKSLLNGAAENADVLLATMCIAAGFAGLTAIMKRHQGALVNLDHLYQDRAAQLHRLDERTGVMIRDYQLLEKKLAGQNHTSSRYPAPEDLQPLKTEEDARDRAQA